jgi:hypothetical protein
VPRLADLFLFKPHLDGSFAPTPDRSTTPAKGTRNKTIATETPLSISTQPSAPQRVNDGPVNVGEGSQADFVRLASKLAKILRVFEPQMQCSDDMISGFSPMGAISK